MATKLEAWHQKVAAKIPFLPTVKPYWKKTTAVAGVIAAVGAFGAAYWDLIQDKTKKKNKGDKKKDNDDE